MKIVCVLGSPRPDGNSSTLASRFCRTAVEIGAEVRTFTLNHLRFRGCQGCEACKTRSDRCVQHDDLTGVLDAVREADVLIMASPVYYGEVSSQLKAFIDRTYAFVVPDYRTNPKPFRFDRTKTLVFILCQSNPIESMCADIFGRYEIFFRVLGFSERHLVRVCGVNAPKDVLARPEALRLAEFTAEKVCRVNSGGDACPRV